MIEKLEISKSLEAKPRNKGGRPKGSRDTKKRYVPASRLLRVEEKTVSIAALAAAGRNMDKVGAYRACQANILAQLMTEILDKGEGAIARRTSLRDLLISLHDIELEHIKVAPIRDITPAGANHQDSIANGRRVPVRLDDWKRREPSDKPPGE